MHTNTCNSNACIADWGKLSNCRNTEYHVICCAPNCQTDEQSINAACHSPNGLFIFAVNAEHIQRQCLFPYERLSNSARHIRARKKFLFFGTNLFYAVYSVRPPSSFANQKLTAIPRNDTTVYEKKRFFFVLCKFVVLGKKGLIFFFWEI